MYYEISAICVDVITKVMENRGFRMNEGLDGTVEYYAGDRCEWSGEVTRFRRGYDLHIVRRIDQEDGSHKFLEEHSKFDDPDRIATEIPGMLERLGWEAN